MKLIQVFGLLLLLIVPVNGFIKGQETSQERGSSNSRALREHNFEIVLQHNDGTELTSWKASIFSLADGKPVNSASSKESSRHLQVGNYLLLLIFDKEISEIKNHKPFTFSIADNVKTVFTLIIGASSEPEMEHGVGRFGADFVESDPRRGRDYINFTLPKDHPELCMERCKNDSNCDAYAYGNHPEWPKARCWLIHGVAVPQHSPYAVSGVIQRESSPYRVQITTEPLKEKE